MLSRVIAKNIADVFLRHSVHAHGLQPAVHVLDASTILFTNVTNITRACIHYLGVYSVYTDYLVAVAMKPKLRTYRRMSKIVVRYVATGHRDRILM